MAVTNANVVRCLAEVLMNHVSRESLLSSDWLAAGVIFRADQSPRPYKLTSTNEFPVPGSLHALATFSILDDYRHADPPPKKRCAIWTLVSDKEMSNSYRLFCITLRQSIN